MSADNTRSSKPYAIRERLFLFAAAVTTAAEKIHARGAMGRELSPQLASAATSAAANAEEADDASSRKDFLAKEKICLRELKESRLRLRVLNAAGFLTGDECRLIGESEELVKIIASIIKNASRNP